MTRTATLARLARDQRAWQAWIARLASGPFAELAHATGFEFAALDRLWRDAVRESCARLLLSSVRERLVPGAYRGGAAIVSIEGDPSPLTLPLCGHGPFELHRPGLEARDLDPRIDDPLEFLAGLGTRAGLDLANRHRLERELRDSIVNLAQARLARELRHALASRGDADRLADPRFHDPEHFVTDGHPWHVMTRVRLGLHRAEVLHYAAEHLASTPIHCVEIDAALTRVAGSWAASTRAWLGSPAPGRVRVPVHPAALLRLRPRFPELFATGQIRVVPKLVVPSRSLLSLRTVALSSTWHLKLACPVHTTSTRRVVSPMSVQNGPIVSALVTRIQAQDPETAPLRLLSEPAAAGLEPRRVGPQASELGAILRSVPEPPQPSDSHGGAWVCAAMGERWPGSEELVIERACAGYEGGRHERIEALVEDWLRALLPPALRLYSHYGVVLEYHTQNTLACIDKGRLHAIWIRDLGGIRLHAPRLSRVGLLPELAEGSFILTDDLDEVQSKLEHTLFHANLSSLFAAAAELGFDPALGWAKARALIQRCYARWRAEPGTEAHTREAHAHDLEALLQARVRAKALLRMRLTERSSDYEYTLVDNQLGP